MMETRLKTQSKATMSKIETVDQAAPVYLEAGQDGYPMLRKILERNREQKRPQKSKKKKRIKE
jgi:ABC-type transporter lipoprotein component MlaA